MFIVLFGDPSSGFEFVGPFKTEDAAYKYGGEYCTAAAWFVETLVLPDAEFVVD